MTIKKSSFGFTLLELVVAMGVSALILQVGVANYQRFNRIQTLKNTGLGVKNALKDAQTKAIAAVKPDACAVTSVLDGYTMTLMNDCGAGQACVKSQAVCDGSYEGPVSTFTLPKNYSFDTIPGSPISFTALRGGSSVTSTIIIAGALSTETWYYSICLNTGGEIKDCGYKKDSFPTCACP